MEEDKNFQQPIPYVIIVNPELHKVIAYQRGSSSTTSWEQRLYGKRSLGVGGHVELEFKDATNPLRETALQEIKEEIWLTSIDSLKVLWYLNDNSDPVWEVHVWIIYLAETSEKSVAIVDGELAKVDFFSPEEIDEIMNSPDCDVESRSRIARKAYKEFIW